MAAHRWSKPTKRKQRIDPRYFLHETADRDEDPRDEEESKPEDKEESD